MKYYIYISLVLLIIFVGCNDKHNTLKNSSVRIENDLVIINLDFLEKGDFIPFDSLYLGYERIKPIVNNLRDTFQYGVWDIYYRDRFNNIIEAGPVNNRVNIYDSIGNKLLEINKVGKRIETGEYRQLYEAIPSVTDSIIYLLLRKPSAIYKYDYKGAFKGYIPLKTVTYSKKNGYEKDLKGYLCDLIVPLSDGNLLIHYAYCGGNIEYNYFITNPNTNKILTTKKTMDDYNGRTRFLSEAKYYNYNNTLHTKDLSDTLYYIKNGEFIPKYVFEQKHTIKKFVDSLGVNVDIYNTGKESYIIDNLNETDRYLFFAYKVFNGTLPTQYFKVAYYDKKNKKAFKYSDKDFIYGPHKNLEDSIYIHSFYGSKIRGDKERYISKIIKDEEYHLTLK
ncbi:MAG: hypothetical protein RR312_08195 [Bacteroidales bacterium]